MSKKQVKRVSFGKCKQVAIGLMMDLWYGRLGKYRLPSPSWEQFTFFESILPGEIVEGECSLAGGSKWQRLERSIKFFGYDRSLMAEVWLVGSRSVYANPDGSVPTFWRVSKVRYRTNFAIVTRHDADAEWHEVSFTQEEMPLQ